MIRRYGIDTSDHSRADLEVLTLDRQSVALSNVRRL